MPNPTITRRAFVPTLAAAVPALAHAQTPTPQSSAPQADRRTTRPEIPPFAEPASFRRSDVALKVRPFALKQVRLLPGAFRQAAEWNRAYIGRLPVDRLVHTFRLNAGLPSAAAPLGGWEEPKVELRGHFTGHYLSACALHYAATGDREIKAKASEIVGELARCQKQAAAGGYLSAFPLEFFDRLNRREKVWAPFYTIHKIMAGLLDVHLLCDDSDALRVLTGMSEWTDSWTASKSEQHMQDILKTEYGGMNEVMYNLAALTNEDRWARAGDRFNKKTFFNPLALRRDELRGLHANTHIPQVTGAARRYELTGDMRFHDVAEVFLSAVVAGHTYATGGTSSDEHWLAEPGRIALELGYNGNHQECCCSYNMMKLARHVYSWTADPRYIDYYERNLYNHRLGTIEPNTGHTIYFLSLSPGALKKPGTEDRSFWCCTGTGVEEYAKLNDTIYYHDDHGVYVNLYAPSELDWTEKGVSLRQSTKFPDEPRTSLTVTATDRKPWAMNLRIPAWTTSDASVRINGKLIEAMASPGSYLAVRRVWTKGDRVDVELPMRVTSEPTPDDPRIQAFLYGPLVLAGDVGSQSPEMISGIKRDDTAPLRFRTAGASKELPVVPLNTLWNRYTVYWKVTA